MVNVETSCLPNPRHRHCAIGRSRKFPPMIDCGSIVLAVARNSSRLNWHTWRPKDAEHRLRRPNAYLYTSKRLEITFDRRHDHRRH